MEAVLHKARSITIPDSVEPTTFLQLHAWQASPTEWIELARAYLQNGDGKQLAQIPRGRTAVAAGAEPEFLLRVPTVLRNGIRVPGGIIRRPSSKYAASKKPLPQPRSAWARDE